MKCILVCLVLFCAFQSLSQQFDLNLNIQVGSGTLLEGSQQQLEREDLSRIESNYTPKLSGGIDFCWLRPKGRYWSLGIDVLHYSRFVGFDYYSFAFNEPRAHDFGIHLNQRNLYYHVGYQRELKEHWSLGLDLGLFQEVDFKGRHDPPQQVPYVDLIILMDGVGNQSARAVGLWVDNPDYFNRRTTNMMLNLNLGRKLTPSLSAGLAFSIRYFPQRIMSFKVYEQLEFMENDNPFDIEKYLRDEVVVRQDIMEMRLFLSYSFSEVIRTKNRAAE